MDTHAFQVYLTNEYKKGISPRYVSAIISRCGRVEQVFDVDLADVNDFRRLQDLAGSITTSVSERDSIRSALNRYAEFKVHAAKLSLAK